MLKVAQYAAQTEDYEKAIEIYEQVRILHNCSGCINCSLHIEICDTQLVTNEVSMNTMYCIVFFVGYRDGFPDCSSISYYSSCLNKTKK